MPIVALFRNRGRRESRALDAPASPCAMGRVETHTGLTGTAETSRLSPRNGFTAYTSSPRGTAFLAPVAVPAQAGTDRRQGRGARTTRLRRTPPRFVRAICIALTRQASIATRATFRDDREASLWRHGLGSKLILICANVKPISENPRNGCRQDDDCREGRCTPHSCGNAVGPGIRDVMRPSTAFGSAMAMAPAGPPSHRRGGGRRE